jgi:hypothetical protein
MRSDRTVQHLAPAEYHRDPVDPGRCLCWCHFGWELIDDLKAACLAEAAGYAFFSRDLGYSDSGLELVHNIAER